MTPGHQPAAAATQRFRVGDHVTCYRRGNRWWAEFRWGGKQHRRTLKTKSAKQARLIGIKIEAELIDGAYRRPCAPITIDELVQRYRAHLRTEGRAASTLKRYEPELQRWRDFFDRIGIRHVGEVDLLAAERYRAERKPQVADKTLYHETTVIKQLYNYAAERGLIATNPLKALKLKRPSPNAQRCFTLEEVNQIIAAGRELAELFTVLAFTGLRIGELRWLTWKDIELNADDTGGRLWVRAKPTEWRPKDRTDRWIPMHPRVAGALARRPREHRFVFTAPPSSQYPRGGHQLSDRRVLQSLKRTLRRLGLRDAKVHTFRHFFVSSCANNGVEPFKLMAWVGHSDLAMVLKYYTLGAAESQRAMAALPFGVPAPSFPSGKE